MTAEREPVSATRLTVFGGAIVIAGAIAAPALAQPSVSDAAFVQGIGFLHPHGRQAALQALAGGMKPECLYTVMLIGDDHRWPALLFKTDTGEHLAFRPKGRD